jgi:hypothetical protein
MSKNLCIVFVNQIAKVKLSLCLGLSTSPWKRVTQRDVNLREFKNVRNQWLQKYIYYISHAVCLSFRPSVLQHN